MMENTESYIEKPYSSKTSLATYLVCGALLTQGGLGLSAEKVPTDISPYYGYSLESITSQSHNQTYQLSSQTWSSFEKKSAPKVNEEIETKINVSESLGMIQNLSFMKVDEAIDKKIEDYFASKIVKTKTIFKNHRLAKG